MYTWDNIQLTVLAQLFCFSNEFRTSLSRGLRLWNMCFLLFSTIIKHKRGVSVCKTTAVAASFYCIPNPLNTYTHKHTQRFPSKAWSFSMDNESGESKNNSGISVGHICSWYDYLLQRPLKYSRQPVVLELIQRAYIIEWSMSLHKQHSLRYIWIRHDASLFL